eukprot:796935_1
MSYMPQESKQDVSSISNPSSNQVNLVRDSQTPTLDLTQLRAAGAGILDSCTMHTDDSNYISTLYLIGFDPSATQYVAFGRDMGLVS